MAEENICPSCEAPLRLIRGELKCPSSLCPGVPEVVEEEAPVEEEVEEVEELEEEEDEEDLDAYLEELPVKELKKLLKDANLNTKGKKADLIARLIE